MPLTPEGATEIWEALGDAWVLRISDGTNTASTVATVVEVDGATLHVEGEFTSTEANFEWRIRSVVRVRPNNEDVTIDREEVDLGRKAEGSIWTLIADVELVVG